MSKEHDHPDTSEPYWTDDVAIGDIAVPHAGERMLRLKVHRSEERYREHAELFLLKARSGMRDYFHAKPYVLEPDITLTVGLYPTPKATGAIGEVVGSEWEGMRHREIGTCQAWVYRSPDATLMIWEVVLFQEKREETFKAAWRGFDVTVNGYL